MSGQYEALVKFKNSPESKYYITATTSKVYAWPAKYLYEYREGGEKNFIDKGKIPPYFKEVTEDNCEILDGVINPKLISQLSK